MRVALSLLVVLIGVGAWWLLKSGPETSVQDDPYDDASSEDTGGGTLLQGRQTDDTSVPGGKRVQGSTAPSLDLRKAPRGELTIIPVNLDDEPIPIDEVAVHLYPNGRKWPSSPLATRNRETNGWEFRDVLVGSVRVVITGQKIHDAVKNTTVTVRAQDPIRVPVFAAGAIRFLIRPKDSNLLAKGKFQIELFRNERPVTAWFQEMHTHGMTSRKKTSQAELGPAGFIMGLKAGMYVVRVTASNGFYDEADLDVREGEVARAPLNITGLEPLHPKSEPKLPQEPGPAVDPELDRHGMDPPPVWPRQSAPPASSDTPKKRPRIKRSK